MTDHSCRSLTARLIASLFDRPLVGAGVVLGPALLLALSLPVLAHRADGSDPPGLVELSGAGSGVDDEADRGLDPDAVRGPVHEIDRRFEEIRRFSSPHANQGVAVDADHFYAITNRAIGKHDKETGRLVDEWVGPVEGPIIHLNSGIVLDGRLYTAHSNYPGVPMVSSIEIWDVETMEHVDSHSFGIFQGSATWADRRDGSWWVGFANYEGWGGQPGPDPSWTTVVRFDDQWRPIAGYVFPPGVVERFEDRSNSGGAWGPDGYLYATGHDHSEVYVLRPPEAGSVLELVETLPVPAEGQAIAWDPTESGVLYTIIRSTSEVVVSKLVEDEP